MTCEDVDSFSRELQSLHALTGFTYLHATAAPTIATCQAVLSRCTLLCSLQLQFKPRGYYPPLEEEEGHHPQNGPGKFVLLEDMLDSIHLPHLTSFQADMSRLADACCMFTRSPGLLHIRLTGWDYTDPHSRTWAAPVSSSLSCLTCLQSCRFDRDESPHSCLCDILSQVSHTVTSLHLHQWHLSEESVHLISTFLNLQHLNLSESPVKSGDANCVRQLSKLTSLKSLYGFSSFHLDVPAALLEAVPDSITCLDLSGNHFPAVSVPSLAELTALQTLKLGSACPIKRDKWWPKDVCLSLASDISALGQLSRLQLEMAATRGKEASADDHHILLNSLKSMPCLSREDVNVIEDNMLRPDRLWRFR